ncbi:MAG: hypothetical protein DMG16_13985 [Acidobacteria bacterium]|nr:MAG: hypothetical protein DMG16_13985 [Acidobacteriota bacterium]
MDRPMKVLLVEDLEESRTVLRAMNERLGHRVVEAAHGKEAVQVALDSNPDLVLMDLSMPEADGLQATSALRAISSFRDVNHLPVIALTAYPETLSVEKAYQAGCDGYLQKPVDLTDLDAALRRFLRTA